MRFFFIIVLCGLNWKIGNALDDLPSNFPRCKRTDPEMEKCLLEATEQVKPYIKNGVPEFLPSIINYTVPKIVMQQGTRAINYKAVLTNLVLMGLEDYKFTKYYLDKDDMSFSIRVELPSLYITGHYNLEGKLFFAPIRGDGAFSANITNTVCAVYHSIEIVKRNGVDFIKPGDTVPTIKIGKVEDYTFDGLFGGNKNLENITNNIIKNNLDVIIDEVRPAVEEVLAAFFENVIFKAVTKIPYDKLYPK